MESVETDYGMKNIPVSSLVGVVLASVDVTDNNEQIIMTACDGRRFLFYHYHDCCEIVEVNDIVGDLSDLIGTPILVAEERTEKALERADYSTTAKYPYVNDDSGTWTFYEIATIKGSVTIRWVGVSNGYYSETVSLTEI